MMKPTAEHIRELLKKQQPAELYTHTLDTAACALELGYNYGCESAEMLNIELGALLHDNCKHWFRGALLTAALGLGYVLDDLEQKERTLLHARVGALRLRRDFGIADKQVFDAVYFHTVGGPGMCRVARIVYCADKLETQREFPGVKDIRAKASEGLAQLCLAVVTAGIEYLKRKHRLIHPATIEFYNELSEETKGLG